MTAPQDSFQEEDFIDATALIDDLLQAIEAGEVPTIDLTNAGNVTVISADVLLAIAASGVDVVVVLPSGFTFTIIASSISENVGAFDLNIEVITKYIETQLETIGGGKVDIPANSIVFRPNFHGEFGFEIVFHITPEQIEDAGIDAETVRRFHVCGVGNVTDHGEPTVNSDGSVNFTIDHASFHVLSNDSPVTAVVGTGVIGSDVVGDVSIGDNQGVGVFAPPANQELAQRAGNIIWILVAVSAAAILAAVSLTILILMRRRYNNKQT